MRKIIILVVLVTLFSVVSCIAVSSEEETPSAQQVADVDWSVRCGRLERDGQHADAFECYDALYARSNPAVPSAVRQQLVGDYLDCVREHDGTNAYGDGQHCDTELVQAFYPTPDAAATLTQEAVPILASVEAYETKTAATETPIPQVEAAPQPPELCSLLPVDRGLVTDEDDFGDWASCTADIDAIVGCSDCGSLMSITRLPGVVEAQESIVIPADCGLATVGASERLPTLALPFGDLGYACPDKPEAYREGVAQSYYSLQFVLDRYSASIFSGFPGQETVILEMGREIADRIEASDAP